MQYIRVVFRPTTKESQILQINTLFEDLESIKSTAMKLDKPYLEIWRCSTEDLSILYFQDPLREVHFF